MSPMDAADGLLALQGQVIVLDLASPYVIVGKLVAVQRDFLTMEDVDAHDLRDSPTTREKYVLDCHEHGIRPNRRSILVRLSEIVALSRLQDVIAS